VRQSRCGISQFDVEHVAPLVREKVLSQVLDELGFGTHAGVTDARLDPAPAVKHAQQVDDVGLADSFHTILLDTS
tara:strand:- start:176 stop:400 length:225 start_codon:yes stop_codon:yes gene_type:complete